MNLLPILLLLSLWTATAHAADKPNVLLVYWDATRADHLGLYGHVRPTTPNLDRIAADATVFAQASPGCYWTLPSVATVFTGLFSHNHRVDYATEATQDYGLDLPDQTITLAMMMKEQGYRTAMFAATRMIVDRDSFNRGLDISQFTREDQIVENTLEFIDQAGDEPWFIIAYWLSPHAPFTPGEEHDLWGREDVDPVNIHGCTDKGNFPEGSVKFCDLDRNRVVFDEDQWDQLRRIYDGEIHRNDAWLGQLWEGLEARNTSDETLFVLTSDHGEAFNDHPREKAWHSYPYENNQLVPLVMRLPGTFPAVYIESAVRTMDLYPTVVELAGGTISHPINGESLLSTLDGSAPDRPNVGATHHGVQYYRNGDYKLIYVNKPGKPFQQLEAYDLKADPLELSNLADSNPELVEKLKAEMALFIEATSLDLGNAGRVTEEQIELLKSMGYIE